MNKRAGFVSLLGSAMIYSLLGIVIRFFSTYLGHASQTGLRAISTLVVLLLVMLVRSEKFRFSWSTTNKLAFVAFCLSGALGTLFFVVSVASIKVANTVFYLYIASFMAAFIVGSLLLGESLTKRKVIAFAMAVLGLVVFSHPIDTSLSWGMIFGLLTGLSDTVHYTSQKYLKDIPRHTLLFWSYAVAGIILCLLALFSGEQLLQPVDIKLVAVVPIFGIVFLALGETLLYGFNNYPLNLGTIVVSGELFFAIVVNAIVLREIPTNTELIGAILMFGAIIVSNTSLHPSTE